MEFDAGPVKMNKRLELVILTKITITQDQSQKKAGGTAADVTFSRLYLAKLKVTIKTVVNTVWFLTGYGQYFASLIRFHLCGYRL